MYFDLKREKKYLLKYKIIFKFLNPCCHKLNYTPEQITDSLLKFNYISALYIIYSYKRQAWWNFKEFECSAT